MKYLCIIQARLGSTRFPNKVMQTVGGVPMVKRVWGVAYFAMCMRSIWRDEANRVIVAWPERYSDLKEENVLDRFRRIINEFKPEYVIRLTADCPLITPEDIFDAMTQFERPQYGIHKQYYSNHKDGHDVQIFNPWVSQKWDGEHVIADFSTPSTGLSVNTPEDLERVRKLCKIK